MSAPQTAVLRANAGAALVRAGGLTILERQIWTLARAGFSRVVVETPAPETAKNLRLPANIEIVLTASPVLPNPDAAEVSGGHLIRPAFLRELLESAANAADQQGRMVLQITGAAKTVNAAAQDALALSDPFAAKPALAWLKGCVAKPQDGFMARHFDRHVSWALTRRLLDTSATPNMLSACSLALGLAGAFLFLSLNRDMRFFGALLVLLHSMLDGCDGELARAKFLESRLGAKLDFWGDNAVHAALFICLGAGFFRQRGNVVPLMLGAAAGISALGAAAIFFQRKVIPGLSGLPKRLSKPDIADVLAGRDFLYLLAPAVFWRLSYLFLQAAAVGSPIFFATMIYANRAPSLPEAS